jgi:hypothetical protein
LFCKKRWVGQGDLICWFYGDKVRGQWRRALVAEHHLVPWWCVDLHVLLADMAMVIAGCAALCLQA